MNQFGLKNQKIQTLMDGKEAASLFSPFFVWLILKNLEKHLEMLEKPLDLKLRSLRAKGGLQSPNCELRAYSQLNLYVIPSVVLHTRMHTLQA